MLGIHTHLGTEVPYTAAAQASELCNQGSEMQRFFDRLVQGETSEEDSGVMVSYAYHLDADEATVVGWATVSRWRAGNETRLQVQAYVRDDYRQRGVATALFACVTSGLPRSSEVAVFSDECMRIARRLRLSATQYRRVADGWIGLGVSEGGDG